MPRGGSSAGKVSIPTVMVVVGFAAIFALMCVILWSAPKDIPTVSGALKTLESTEYQGSVKDGPDMFAAFLYKDRCVKWFRVAETEGNIHYLFKNSVLLDSAGVLSILVRTDPNEYVSCKEFLKIAGEDPSAFCRENHLPLSKIRSICRGW